jgi:hypothetical protein
MAYTLCSAVCVSCLQPMNTLEDESRKIVTTSHKLARLVLCLPYGSVWQTTGRRLPLFDDLRSIRRYRLRIS